MKEYIKTTQKIQVTTVLPPPPPPLPILCVLLQCDSPPRGSVGPVKYNHRLFGLRPLLQ
jgi:hypothetical protein